MEYPFHTLIQKNTIRCFDVVSTIYDKYKPKGRKSFLSYPFVLKQILIMRDMDQYAKYIPNLKDTLKAEGTRTCVGSNN